MKMRLCNLVIFLCLKTLLDWLKNSNETCPIDDGLLKFFVALELHKVFRFRYIQ